MNYTSGNMPVCSSNEKPLFVNPSIVAWLADACVCWRKDCWIRLLLDILIGFILPNITDHYFTFVLWETLLFSYRNGPKSCQTSFRKGDVKKAHTWIHSRSEATVHIRGKRHTSHQDTQNILSLWIKHIDHLTISCDFFVLYQLKYVSALIQCTSS